MLTVYENIKAYLKRPISKGIKYNLERTLVRLFVKFRTHYASSKPNAKAINMTFKAKTPQKLEREKRAQRFKANKYKSLNLEKIDS